MFRAAARLNVALGWVPERLAEGNFNLEEPPERASPWVGVLLSHLATFRQKLATAASLTPQDLALVVPPLCSPNICQGKGSSDWAKSRV